MRRYQKYSASWFCDSGHLPLGAAEETNNKKDSSTTKCIEMIYLEWEIIGGSCFSHGLGFLRSDSNCSSARLLELDVGGNRGNRAHGIVWQLHGGRVGD